MGQNRRVLLLGAITLAGLLVAAASGYFLFQDWAALQRSFAHFEQLAARGADLRALFIAEARQNVHRLNCFAEGVGVLSGMILTAIGLHGLCLLPRSRPPVGRTDA